MPSEFVASFRTPFHSQPISFSRSAAQAQASKDSVTKSINTDVEQQPNGRSSLESVDSLVKGKESVDSPVPKSTLRSALDKVRRKLTSSDKDRQVLDGSEEEFERKKERDVALERRKKEEERFGVKDRVHMNING